MRVAASAALAVAVLSGCTTTVAGHAQAPVEVRYHLDEDTTAGNSPTPSVNAVPESDYEWADVSSETFHLVLDEKGAQYTPDGVAYPGATIVHRSPTSASGWSRCTIGPAAVQSAAPETHGFLTAGHCGLPDPQQRLQVAPEEDPQRSIVFTPAVDAMDDDLGIDSAALWPGSGIARAATRIADKFPVAGVLKVEAARKLIGKPLCFTAAVSGVKCGPLTSFDDAGRMRFSAMSTGGDSGAPVFAVDRRTRRAVLLGILLGGNDTTTTASYLDPALSRLGAKALMAAEERPFTGDDFSPLVAQSP